MGSHDDSTGESLVNGRVGGEERSSALVVLEKMGRDPWVYILTRRLLVTQVVRIVPTVFSGASVSTFQRTALP